MKPFSYYMPTEAVLAPGCFDTLGSRCAALGTRPLLVTGRSSARETGALDRALAQLPGAAVFDHAEQNPSSTICERGAAFCRDNACDFIVTLGGGSAMDTAKAIAVLAPNGGACADYYGKDRYNQPALPLMAVPTTAGTGSEVTPYAVLVDAREQTKRTIAGRDLFPTLALIDPELHRTMPRGVTLNTGLDALSQAMEGMVSLKSTLPGNALALEAVRLIRDWLPVAARDGANIEARFYMAYAAMLTGCVIAQSGTTLVHGMGYYFTMHFGIPHGLANALLLPPVFRYNAAHEPRKVAALALALGCPCEPCQQDLGEGIAEALYAFYGELGVSPAGRRHGVDETGLERCIGRLWADRGRFKNQVGEPSLEEVRAFYSSALNGGF